MNNGEAQNTAMLDDDLLVIHEKYHKTARWHGVLQAKFEIETFGHTLYGALDPAKVSL
jgi:hypothetical protein